MSTDLTLVILFFFVALFYSSVGFGGGSSYLAILSLFLADFYLIRSTALILNIIVVSIGTIMYVRHRIFDWSLFWPFIILSIPFAYLGATMRLSERSFFLVLGSLLISSGLFILLRHIKARLESRRLSLSKKLGLGGSIGFLAGLSGIGGGIFLSPALNLYGWANTRVIASLASVFILVNSVSGLIGLTLSGTLKIESSLLIQLLFAVGLGALLGSYLSNRKFKLRLISILTAILVLYVGIRLVLLHGLGVKI